MNPSDTQHELLMRYLDGGGSAEEQSQVTAWLRTDPAARQFLREVAEQSVMIVDLERIAQGRQGDVRHRSATSHDRPRRILPVSFLNWRWGLAAALLCLLGVLASIQFSTRPEPLVVRVAKVTGSSQYFGVKGKNDHELTTGTLLSVGDTLETRSCDAWIELELGDGSTLAVAGHSTLRILDVQANRKRFKLLEGSLWVSPAPEPEGESIQIETPTASMATARSQFDVQTSSSETKLRVNEGMVRVVQRLDGGAADVPADYQVAISLSRKEALNVTPQPKPINYWACDLWQVPEVILGKWLPPTDGERARLGAEPLLWPIPGRDPLTLYAVALAAWKSSEHPVLLQSNSALRVRGRTDRAHTVRFGVSTQRMQGVFAGKFEIDVAPTALGPAGEPWEVELPLAEFRPLHPQLSISPEGLELTDIYALTIDTDAGLQINHVELRPAATP